MRSGPTTVLPTTSTPPLLSVTRTGPTMVFGSQPGPPTSTVPVLALSVSGPVIVAPQIRTTVALLATTGPVIRPPSTSSDPPGATVTGPVWTPPAPTQTASPDATCSAPVLGPVRHGREYDTVSVPSTNESN